MFTKRTLLIIGVTVAVAFISVLAWSFINGSHAKANDKPVMPIGIPAIPTTQASH